MNGKNSVLNGLVPFVQLSVSRKAFGSTCHHSRVKFPP